MELAKFISEAKNLIKDDLDKALKVIGSAIKPQSSRFDELIQVESRLNQLHDEVAGDIIDDDARLVALNKIRKSLIHLLNQLSEEDIKPVSGPKLSDGLNQDQLMAKLKELIAENERLKTELNEVKAASKQKIKVIIKCTPEIKGRPSNYACVCQIFDDDTGETIEKEIELRREPGGIVATIYDIKPSDYIQIKVKGGDQEWESTCFSPQFLTQDLHLI